MPFPPFPRRKFRMSADAIRHDWTRAEVAALMDLPFADLLARAHAVHRAHHDANAVQVSTLLSVKTGGCPEDCAYCPQAARYATGVDAEKLMSLDAVLAKAKQAKAAGATRFCMGAAWRSPKDRDIPKIAAMVGAVKALGMETCATLGMLTQPQADALKRRRPRLLQPQSRFGAGVLRRDHPHARIPGSPRHARIRARRRPQDLLRRHRRHGRDARAARRPAAGARESARASAIGADQPARAGRRHAARRHRAARSVRIRAHDRGRAHPDAEVDGAPVGRPRRDERRVAGAVFLRRRELDLLRRETADDRQSRRRARSAPVRAARCSRDAGRGRNRQPCTRDIVEPAPAMASA